MAPGSGAVAEPAEDLASAGAIVAVGAEARGGAAVLPSVAVEAGAASGCTALGTAPVGAEELARGAAGAVSSVGGRAAAGDPPARSGAIVFFCAGTRGDDAVRGTAAAFGTGLPCAAGDGAPMSPGRIARDSAGPVSRAGGCSAARDRRAESAARGAIISFSATTRGGEAMLRGVVVESGTASGCLARGAEPMGPGAVAERCAFSASRVGGDSRERGFDVESTGNDGRATDSAGAVGIEPVPTCSRETIRAAASGVRRAPRRPWDATAYTAAIPTATTRATRPGRTRSRNMLARMRVPAQMAGALLV